jgi:transposase InsO family protein
VKFGWIDRHKSQFEVRLMCEVLDVSKSGYYAHKRRPISGRKERRQTIVGAIRAAHAASRGTYGSPRVAVELKASGGPSACQNTIAKYMRQEGIVSKIKRRFRVGTTDSNHDHPIADNVLDRRFDDRELTPAPDRTWCVDITYVPTRQGWLYVAVVMDLFSRKIVGWAMADHLRAELCMNALSMAIERRRPVQSLLHHSDRGVQYACDGYREFLARHAIQASMSRTGNCYDNAAMESFFGTLKTELVHHEDYATREQARSSVFEFIEVFYNRQRRHSAIGYMSPETFEASLN